MYLIIVPIVWKQWEKSWDASLTNNMIVSVFTALVIFCTTSRNIVFIRVAIKDYLNHILNMCAFTNIHHKNKMNLLVVIPRFTTGDQGHKIVVWKYAICFVTVCFKSDLPVFTFQMLLRH